MEKRQNESGFCYTYSAREQEEVRRIRGKYEKQTEEREESKLERLRRLDRSATGIAQRIALTVGVIGALVLGLGMSMLMTELSAMMELAQPLVFPLGIAIGALGCVLICLAYPLYSLILRRRRQRIAPEILRLSDELMK